MCIASVHKLIRLHGSENTSPYPLPFPLIRIPVREFLVPLPRAIHDGIERLKLRIPAQFFPYFLRRSNQSRRIAGPSRFFNYRNFAPGDFTTSLDYFANARSATGAEIVK